VSGLRTRTGGPTRAPAGDDPDREAATVAVATLPSRLSVAAGAWLLVAPFALSYSTTGTGFRAYWNDVVVGVAVIAVAALQIAAPGRLSALPPLAAALGGWLAAAPFVLGFASNDGAPGAVVNDVLVGALLVVLALLGRSLGRRLSRADLLDPPVTGPAGRHPAGRGDGTG
jgi:SPW repeat